MTSVYIYRTRVKIEVVDWTGRGVEEKCRDLRGSEYPEGC